MSLQPVGRRVLIVAGLVSIAVAGALLFEMFLSLESVLSFGHTRQGHVTGWIGLAVILLVFLYPIRKRAGQNRMWPRGWFQIHMVAGVVGPLLIVLHAGAHLHALVPILAMVSMGIVALSGIIGQAVHYLALRTLNEERRQLLEQGVSPGEAEVRLHDVASREETFRVWQLIHAPMTLLFMVLVVLHVVGAMFFGGL
ncbi:MAG: hypothetical protein Q8L77_13050 [Nitrospirota bacterium]|nr:hypothetical protein [Nitrospirota bacterium]